MVFGNSIKSVAEAITAYKIVVVRDSLRQDFNIARSIESSFANKSRSCFRFGQNLRFCFLKKCFLLILQFSAGCSIYI